jgi:hypothetical protein
MRTVGHERRDDIAPEIGEASSHGKAEAVRRVVVDAAHCGVGAAEGLDDVLGPVDAVIVYNEDLVANARLFERRSNSLYRIRNMTLPRYGPG